MHLDGGKLPGYDADAALQDALEPQVEMNVLAARITQGDVRAQLNRKFHIDGQPVFEEFDVAGQDFNTILIQAAWTKDQFEEASSAEIQAHVREREQLYLDVFAANGTTKDEQLLSHKLWNYLHPDAIKLAKKKNLNEKSSPAELIDVLWENIMQNWAMNDPQFSKNPEKFKGLVMGVSTEIENILKTVYKQNQDA